MTQQDDFSKCRHFDTPRCPNQNLDLMKRAAFDVPEYRGGKPQQMPEYDINKVNEICKACDKYKLI